MLHGETIRLLRLELTPLGNETFMRLIGRVLACRLLGGGDIACAGAPSEWMETTKHQALGRSIKITYHWESDCKDWFTIYANHHA